MASNSHLGRIVALQTLYEFEFQSDAGYTPSVNEIKKRNLEKYNNEIEDYDFIDWLVDGVIGSQKQLDDKLQPLAPDWPIDQISRIDRSILRIGLFELTSGADKVPHKVAINEAVELAKSFGSDNSGKFVNGVLGAAYRKFVEGEPKTNESTGKI